MPPPHAVEDSVLARGPSTKPLWSPTEEPEDSPSAWMERPLQPCEPESPEASTPERGRALFHPACWASLRDALNPLAYNPPPAPLSQDCDASPGAFHLRGSEESFDQSIHLESEGTVHVPTPLPEGESRSLRGRLSTLWAYAGPGLLISVGYMDPGNWSTDIFGGAAFGYDLLFVVLVSCLAAMLLQALSLRLGVATGRNLAQLCRDRYPLWVSKALWLLAEGAIAACDLAEVLGTAIALKLLLGIPLPWGVVITAFDVLLLLALTGRSARMLEALIAVLLAIVGACFIWTLVETSPPARPVLSGFVPKKRIFTDGAELYAAAGILGATVMPHNLYLHSALVQTRDFRKDARGKREAARYGLVDSTCALIYAGFVNAAILVTAASAFAGQDAQTVSSLPDAARLLAPALGSAAATKMFGVGLLSSGQQSTITGTLAGQIVMEGFLGGHGLKPWARRLLTRLLALVPAVVVAATAGDSGVATLLNASQVALSIQLPFAIFPLVQLTGRREMMGDMANGRVLATVSWLIFLAITAINAKLIVDFGRGA